MRILHSLLLSLAALLAAPNVHAARTAPLVNYEDLVVTSSDGRPLTAEQVSKAIVTGASRSRWAASVQPGSKIRLTYHRSSHTAIVEVVYSTKSYSIRYADSANLNYSQDGGKPVIHPNYNKWINNLRLAIDVALRST